MSFEENYLSEDGQSKDGKNKDQSKARINVQIPHKKGIVNLSSIEKSVMRYQDKYKAIQEEGAFEDSERKRMLSTNRKEVKMDSQIFQSATSFN